MKPHRRALFAFERENNHARKINAEHHSLRADLDYKLSVRNTPYGSNSSL